MSESEPENPYYYRRWKEYQDGKDQREAAIRADERAKVRALIEKERCWYGPIASTNAHELCSRILYAIDQLSAAPAQDAKEG